MTYKKRRPGSRKSKLLIIIPMILIAVFVIITACGAIVSRSDKVFPNIYLKTIKLSGMTRSEVLSLLKENGWNDKEDTPLTVVTYRDVSVEINPVEAGEIIDTCSAADAALKYGKAGGIYQNLNSFIRCLGNKTDINELNAVLDKDYINAKLDELQSKLNNATGYEKYYVDEAASEIVIFKGYGSTLILDRDLLEEQIISALESGTDSIVFTALKSEPEDPDYDRLQELIHAEPEDASFSTNGSHTIIEEKPGYTFDVSAASALWKSSAAGDEIRLPLEVHHSIINSEYLESRMYRDLLGAMTTKYNNSGENRSSNVRLATSLVNGSIIFPGEEFSFNDTVGKRTEEAGFTYAPAYAGYDNIREEIGGGVCQVSTGHICVCPICLS
jgi:Uncharacterized vancomycin resistance protein